MNKLKYFFFLIGSISLFFCNKNSGNHIEITQNKTELSVIVRLAKDNNNRIITIQFPIEINIKNNSLKEKTFLRMYYNFNKNIPKERGAGFGMNLFKRKNDTLEKIQNKKTKINNTNLLAYICYSVHYVDSTQSTKLDTYIEEMNLLEQDTLHIGTVREFKKKHTELFNTLTWGDSLSIQFLEGRKLGERITVPVEW